MKFPEVLIQMNTSRAKEALLNIAIGLVTVCALVVTGIRVREFLVSEKADGRVPTRTVSDWRKFASQGHRFGPPSAAVTIVEFADFQCPYCRAAATSLKELQSWYKDDVAVIYRHYPLRTHDFAREAAYAAICSEPQGHFEVLHDLLFAQADSIGHKEWSRFASEAGVADTISFLRCMSSPATSQVVTRDSLAGTQLGIRATPTFLINETLISGHPGFEELNNQVINALRSSRANGRRRS